MSQHSIKKVNKKLTIDPKITVTTRRACLLCNDTFASASSLSHHKKRCKMANNTKVNIDHCKLGQNNKNSTETSSNSQTYDYLDNISPKSSKYTHSIPIVDSIVNINILFSCSYCTRDTFSSASSLARHMKACGKKVELEKENVALKEKINMLLIENKNLLNDKRLLNKDKEILNKVTDKFADIAVSSTNIINKGMSAMTFFMNNFKNTPALESIDDLSTMKIKYINTNHFILELLSKYRNDTLASYIGDYIINIYKKKDSSKQTMWSSDVNRLTYIISEAVAKGKTIWVTDKKGIKVGDMVVRPALDYIRPILQKYIKECNKDIISNNTRGYTQSELLEYQKFASHIILSIDNNVLEKEITKYIAPQLFWNKNLLLETDKDGKIGEIKQLRSLKPPKKIKKTTQLKKVKKKKTKIVVEETNSEEELIDTDSDEELVESD
jgi:hypothetical protein